MRNADDKKLAFACYGLAGIPLRQWDAHYKIDATSHGALSKDARRVYSMIVRSYEIR